MVIIGCNGNMSFCSPAWYSRGYCGGSGVGKLSAGHAINIQWFI
jgi:hypothetical protein